MSRKHYRIIAYAIGTIADDAGAAGGGSYGRLSRPAESSDLTGARFPSACGVNNDN